VRRAHSEMKSWALVPLPAGRRSSTPIGGG
jgi:hypothetical protein